jgi:amino acid adenylation domain-containing protein
MNEPRLDSLALPGAGSRFPAITGYWRRAAGRRPAFSSLPRDTAGEAGASERNRHTIAMNPLVAGQIAALSRGDGILAFCVLSAAVAMTAARWTARQDAVLVIPPLAVQPAADGRAPAPEMTERPGLALSVPVPGDAGADAVLRHIRRETLAVYGRQRHVPALDSGPDGGIAVHVPQIHGDVPPDAAIVVRADVRDGRMAELVSEADASLYTPALHAWFAEACAGILVQLAGDPRQAVTRLIGAAEREAGRPASLLFGERPAKPEATLIGLFREQAARTPGHAALACGQHGVTYAELDARSGSIAAALIRRGAVPGSLVGVCLDRSIDAVTAVLGTLKAGCGYLPLPPDQPRARTDALLAATRPAAILTDSTAGPGGQSGVTVIDVRAIGPNPDPYVPAEGRGPLCVLHTSGSTGTPHPVAINESAVLNRLRWMWRTEPFSPGENLVLTKSLGLVGSLWECFGGLLQGVLTEIATASELLDPAQLWNLLARHRITRLHTTPTTLAMLLGEAERRRGETLDALRLLFSSAEPLPPSIAGRWLRRFPAHRLANLYGLTECSSNTAIHRVDATAPAGPRLPVGMPIDHTGLYILDERGQPVPHGAAGELHVGGHCVAAGYVGMPELTARRFVTDPFWPAEDGASARMFRTGDLARVLTDGTVELIGRRDLQVKIRGFRVSLEEVEDALSRHPQVAEAAAALVEDNRTGERLVGYLVPRHDAGSGAQLTAAVVRAHCARLLPSHMVPAEFVVTEALPRLPSGKIARALLSAPEPAQGYAGAPVDGRRAAVVDAVAKVAGRAAMLADRLEDLDMHSLRVVQLHRRLTMAFGEGIDLLDLFRCSTVEDLCALADGGSAQNSGGDDELRRRAERRRRGLAAAAARHSRHR